MRHQRWSVEALGRVRQVAGERYEGDPEEYKTLCMKMPSVLQQSGLVQAIVFAQSRGPEGRRYCDDIARVLGREDAQTGADLRERAQRAELPAYLAMSRDVSEVAGWLRRFAQIELGEP